MKKEDGEKLAKVWEVLCCMGVFVMLRLGRQHSSHGDNCGVGFILCLPLFSLICSSLNPPLPSLVRCLHISSEALYKCCFVLQEYGVPFMETSAKSGLNVELAFTAIAK